MAMLRFVVAFLFVSYLLTHLGHFGPYPGQHYGSYSGHFSPFFIFLGLLFLFAILRHRNRWNSPSGGGYGQGGPSAPGPSQGHGYANPQGPVQGPGGYASPY